MFIMCSSNNIGKYLSVYNIFKLPNYRSAWMQDPDLVVGVC